AGSLRGTATNARGGHGPRNAPGERGRVLPRATRHDDDDVLRFLDDSQGSLSIHLADTVATPRAEDVGVALADLVERNAGLSEQGLTYPLLVEALARRDRGVFRAEHEEGLMAHEHVVRAGGCHRARDRGQHVLGGLSLLRDVGRGPPPPGPCPCAPP